MTPLPTNGIGNITGPPLFMDMAAGDFRLREDSPCVDAGANLLLAEGYSYDPTHIVGNTRFIVFINDSRRLPEIVCQDEYEIGSGSLSEDVGGHRRDRPCQTQDGAMRFFMIGCTIPLSSSVATIRCPIIRGIRNGGAGRRFGWSDWLAGPSPLLFCGRCRA
jgi:hypothetical protein